LVTRVVAEHLADELLHYVVDGFGEADAALLVRAEAP
jgi:hypothetical protein